MKVVGMNGREYRIDLKKYIVRGDDTKKRSSYHLRARDILRETFKGYSVLEEVKLPGSRNPSKKSALFLDFLIPSVMIGFEVHGKQHYEFCSFFHKTKAGFYGHKRRDAIKKEWCEINEVTLVEFSYLDSDEEWRDKIDCAREA